MNNQPDPIRIHHDKHVIKLNASIIIGYKSQKIGG